MSFKKIGSKTSYYPGSCNIGYCEGLVIEGGDRRCGVPAANALKEEGISPRWLLNTHGHPDHYGGDYCFTALGAELLGTREQQPYMEQPGLFSMNSYGTRPPTRQYDPPDYIICNNINVDRIITPGVLQLGGSEFVLEEHKGHSFDQLSILTPDGVAFLGDILLAEKALEYFKLPQLISVQDTFDDIEAVRNMKASCFVPSHGDVFHDPEKLCNMNRDNMLHIISIVYDRCKTDCTRDEAGAAVLAGLCVKPTIGNFFMARNVAAAVLVYLISNGSIDAAMDKNCCMVHRWA